MDYIVYADIMIFWSFIINVFTLIIASRLMHIRIKIKRLLIWSLITGIITDIIYILLLGNTFLPIFYALIYLFMTCMYFKANTLRELLKSNLCVIVSMLFIYGIINVFTGGEQSSLAHILISLMIGILLFLLGARLISHKYSGRYHKLILKKSNNSLYVTGYQDTGNTLINPYNGKPVIIIDYRLTKKLINEKAFNFILEYTKNGYMDYEKFGEISDIPLYPIPYSTINSTYEIMPVFVLDELIFKDEGRKNKNVSCGISRYKLNNDFQVLINEKLEN